MESKYSFGCSTSKPNGCLLNPEGSRMIFFEECKNSTKPSFKIHTHLFYTNHLREPGGYKSSKKLTYIQPEKSRTNLTKKRGQKYLKITDKGSGQEKAFMFL